MKINRQIAYWALYDFANSSYALMIISFIFPIYFREVLAPEGKGDFYWGLIGSISILLGGIAAPLVGAAADHDGRRKTKFTFFVFLIISATGLLFFVNSHLFLWACLLFIIANFGFEIASTLYDSFLNQLGPSDKLGKISGFAYGLGYIGGVAAMIIFRPLYENGYQANENLYKLTFPLTALFVLVFSLPMILGFKDKNQASETNYKWINLIKEAGRRVRSTFKNLRQHKNTGKFLIASYFMNDALVTIFSFVPIYGVVTLNLSIKEITILFLLVQILAFPFSLLFGWLSDKMGSKKILLITLTIWIITTTILSFAETKELFYACALAASLAIGSSQAVARSWFSKIIPDGKRFEFFGFNGFASKIAATTGPLLFGTISTLTGNQRYAMLSLLPLFIVSFIIFLRVSETNSDYL